MPDHRPQTMLDRGAFWTPVPNWTAASLGGTGWTARPVLNLHRLLVSGNIDAALASVAPGAPSIGLWQIAEGEVHALRIARDRLLITATEPLAFTQGWSANGFAVSLADDAWITFEIAGPKLRELMAEMAFVDLEGGSPSAATQVCGQPVLLHRTGETTARLHVEATLAAFLWNWLERR